MELCKCCTSHPEEARETNKVVTCTHCGQQCRCDGCVAEEGLDPLPELDAMIEDAAQETLEPPRCGGRARVIL